jgi:hypothetical protein
MLRVRKTGDGSKNAVFEVVVSGDKDLAWTTVVRVDEMSPRPKRARIDGIHYALSDKVEVQLAWHHPKGARHAFLPLGGRGKIAWDDNHPGAPVDEEFSGDIEIRTVGLKPGGLVYLMLDMTKQ